jgi:hypothetical protein
MIMDTKHRQQSMSIIMNAKTKVDKEMIAKITDRIESMAKNGIIDSFTNLSIGGQILHVLKYDVKAGKRLEKLFDKHVKNVYEGGSRSFDCTIKPCLKYRYDKTHAIKCSHLTS